MSPLPPNQHLAAPSKWPVVGERQAAACRGEWTVAIAGLVARPARWTLGDLEGMPQVERAVDIHCVTRWSKLGCRFGGVPLAALLDAARHAADARFVSFVAHSERRHTTSLPLGDLLELDALVALRYEGQPLAPEHGGPVRVIVPGRYFYKSLKWLTRIELLAEDRLGYWEAEAGYHNVADPWREQRYMAAALSRQEMAAALAERDFSGRDLRSLEARGHELPGLVARGALLRDADFSHCNLAGAVFDGANLSNARLGGADLSGASFREANVEGADFSGAILRGADFRGASLLGATFASGESNASLDPTTQFDLERLGDLAPEQAAFLRQAIAC